MKHKRFIIPREELVAWSFLFPNLLGFLCISLIPIIASLVISLTNWIVLKKPSFVGFDNFIQLFKDERFIQVLWNTLYFTIGTIPVGIVLAVLIATLLNQKIPFTNFYRTLIFMPVVSSTVASALLWKWLYAKDIGLIAYFLRVFGIRAPDFLLDPNWAMPAVIIFSIWKSLGYNVVLFLAGLQGIPSNLLEAAKVDGATSLQSYTKITLPLLTPTVFFVFVISLISSFQVFDQTFVLTEGGPGYATSTIVYYLYQNGFVWYKMGYACAIAWILFMVIMCITIIQWKLQEKWVYYE